MQEKYSKELMRKNLENLLCLEWLGIHVEDVKDIPGIVRYYFSVPERSTIELDGLDADTSDKLIALAKDELTNMLLNDCDDLYDEEFVEDVRNNISDYAKFYAKVRTGETWTKELGDAAIKKIKNDILADNKYKEV